MQRRSALAAAVLTASALTVSITPAAQAAESVTGRVLQAALQADGSVATQVVVTCPKGNAVEMQVAISQEFESNGGRYDAVAYSPPVARDCTGRAQRTSARTTASDRAPFQPHVGRRLPAGATRPTLGTVLVSITAADGLTTEHYNLENAIVLK